MAPRPKRTIGEQVRQIRRAVLPRLWSLRLDGWRLERKRERELDGCPEEDRDPIKVSYYADLGIIEQGIEAICTRRLMRQAGRFDVELPDRPRFVDDFESEYWELASMTGEWLLKAAGKQLIRKQIREERRARFEVWARWAQLLTPLAGLIGVLTGLIYAIKKG